MKKIFIILLLNGLFVHALIGQSLIQQIENAYSSLDSTSYMEKIIVSYKEDLIKLNKETEDLMLELRGTYNNMDSIQRQNMLDSVMGKTIILSYKEDLTKKKVWERILATHTKSIAYAYLNINDSIHRRNILDSLSRDFSKIWMERDYSIFMSAIKDKPAHYVLNLIVDNCKQPDNICLLPDTSNLPFNLFYFDKRLKLDAVVFVDKGQYSWFDSCYRSFSMVISKNAPKVFKKIMKKKPKYLLYCYQLDEMNTILYMLNDKIYVYRIGQMDEYELNDYLRKYPPRWSEASKPQTKKE